MAPAPHPPDANTAIWRYMDDWKFADLLSTFSENLLWRDDDDKTVRCFNEPGQLWFSYPWTLAEGAGGEGTLPAANADPSIFCDRIATVRGLSEDEARVNKERFLAIDTAPLRAASFYMAQLCGVSCWHDNVDENPKMWDCNESDNGVAVRTSVGAMEHALGWAHNTPAKQAQPSVCAVGYFNHRKDFLEYDGYRCLLAIVGETWDYEQEVRYVAKSHYFRSLPLIRKQDVDIRDLAEDSYAARSTEELMNHVSVVAEQAKSLYDELRSREEKGFHLPIKLEGLIHEVLVSPESDANYLSEVRSMLDQVGLSEVPVRASHGEG